MKIGILGGTFNPIHYGHLFVANYVMDYKKLDKILFLPSGKPPHKDNVLDKKHREKMVKLAIQDNEKFCFSDIEIKKDNYSYTYETLTYLKKEYEDTEFYYIVGKDSFLGLDTWYKWEQLLEIANFIVVSRGEPIHIDEINKLSNVNATFIDSPNIEISSTDIRQRVSQGQSIEYFVNKDVEKYIKDNGLYKQ